VESGSLMMCEISIARCVAAGPGPVTGVVAAPLDERSLHSHSPREPEAGDRAAVGSGARLSCVFKWADESSEMLPSFVHLVKSVIMLTLVGQPYTGVT
jgi:hypothetical protein